MNEAALRSGVRREEVGEGVIHVFEPSKTIADLFKFRHRVELDVALQGLQAYWHSPHRDVSALQHYARIDRVEKLMRPYLEMVAA